MFTKEFEPHGEIPLERGPLINQSNNSMKDRFLLRIEGSDTIFPYWNLISSIYKTKNYPFRFIKHSWGPDAIDKWWTTETELKDYILSIIRNSEYLAEYLNIGELIKILNSPFILNLLLRIGIPSILAIHYVGKSLEYNNQSTSSDLTRKPFPAIVCSDYRSMLRRKSNID